MFLKYHRCLLYPKFWPSPSLPISPGAAAYPNAPHISSGTKQVLVAFGDSYTYIQGTTGYPNFTFIGSYLPDEFAFTPSTLLRTRIVQNFTATAQGGPNWVEYLTGCGLKDNTTTLPSSCDMQLWDFAFAGADISQQYLPLHHDYTIPLVNQTQRYLTYAEPTLRKRLDKKNSLVAIWIGINDVNDSLRLLPNASSSSSSSYVEFWNTLISTVFAQSVKPLLDAGYANLLVVNLPPLDRTAANQKLNNPRPNKQEVAWWNAALVAHASTFAEENPEARTMVYDANTFLNAVMDEPAKYAIVNTTSWCPGYNQLDVLTTPEKYGCGKLDEYFWYNSGHLTSHVHKIMVPDLVKFLRSESKKYRKC
ncbi:carbohydrate esterase family 16 protein [Pleomassaria siparia CBS 279.74]|uniref:Carbohydrate esterase family 16 protein n=1 Tax=Pleomassaria siparia CBS 279.74 TaxID=1314801 RepID=A0A6G1JWZ6_9PLEO|nr:carbohydrate esterase family 16 protein [Pleomassaria siparia CBS 279.74]